MRDKSSFPQISIESESQRFQSILSLPGNDRIIFSGVFGSGKTYFLNEFFKNKDNYVCLHLYPTNYSVSSNRDIFEYIKYDILYELVSKKIYLDRIELTDFEALSIISSKDYYNILREFIEIIPKIGKTIVGVIDFLERIKTAVSSSSVLSNEGKQIAEYVKKFEVQKGSLYENDFYTRLIIELIERLRGEGDKKREIVLIIDDLDRIDPEHIFRILNILAVHFNDKKIIEYENKFALDRIILCCDSNNIRSVFYARYGQNVDFSGYIDKFYSRDIFQFNNSELVASVVTEVYNSIGGNQSLSGNDPVIRDYLIYFLKSMIRSNALSLRTLKRLYGASYRLGKMYIPLNGKRLNLNEILMFRIFHFIEFIVGDKYSTMTGLQKTSFSQSYLNEGFSKQLLLLADFNNHQFVFNTVWEYEGVKYKVLRDYYYSVEIEHGIGFATLEMLSPIKFKKMILDSYNSFCVLNEMTLDA